MSTCLNYMRDIVDFFPAVDIWRLSGVANDIQMRPGAKL